MRIDLPIPIHYKLHMKKIFLAVAVLFTSICYAVKWEYAALINSDTFTLQLPDRTVRGKDIQELMGNLKCGNMEAHMNGLMNCLGNQGWEFAILENSGAMKIYRFKRVGK